MFLILFRNILCRQQMFPCLRSPRNSMSNNVSATICPRLPVPLSLGSGQKTSVRRKKGKCARLVCDLHGNVVLVQRIYVCVRGRLCHKLMSATPDVMNTLPKVIQEYFPFLLTEKSGYTKTLVDYTEAQLLQGVNFLKISEGILLLFLSESFADEKNFLQQRSGTAEMGISMSHFYQNSLFSYSPPS